MVTLNKKRDNIQQMFNTIAPSYDVLNHALSLGIDKCWRKRLARLAAGVAPKKLLDIATGTGDLAISIARQLPTTDITGADFSSEMLKIASQKATKSKYGSRISFKEEDATAMSFKDGEFDMATAAFGVRNFADLGLGISEMYRVLAVPGTLAILELTVPTNIVFKTVYNIYFKNILPLIGRLKSKNNAAYSYLPLSVAHFPATKEFILFLEEAGFKECQAKQLTFGICTLYTAKKR